MRRRELGVGLALGIGLGIGLLAATASSDGEAPTADEPALRLVVSVYPLELIARELGGERVEVRSLVPPGATPHAFEPRPSDLERLARADAFLRVGGGLDGWASSLLGAAPTDLATWTALEAPGLELLGEGEGHAHRHAAEGEEEPAATRSPPEPGEHGEAEEDAHEHEEPSPSGADPHVWLDPIRVRDALLPHLQDLLLRLDPAGRSTYARRREALAEDLTALDAEIREILARVDGRRYVAFHNAWRYFAQRYRLEEVGVVQEFAGEEPSPREVARLVVAAREAGVGAILVEPQLQARMAEVIGSEFGARTVVVDPLGDPASSERRDYAGLLRFNARAFAEALGPGPSP